MNFNKALEVINKNNHLIGSDYKGSTLDEFIILPTDLAFRDIVTQQYVANRNAQQAIAPYINQDVEVFCVFDVGKINANGVLLTAQIGMLSDRLDIDLD